MKQLLIIIVFFLLINFGCIPRHVIKPFTTDKCSASKEGFKEMPNIWCDCCVIHDTSYWKGGTRAERKIADQKLRDCVASKGGEKYLSHSKKMYLAVRLFGGSFMPFPWRWGYGWRYGHGYSEPTNAELDSINAAILLPESQNAIKKTCIEANW